MVLLAGILEYLQHHYDLSGCTMVGSSAGALLSVLSACNVSAQAALDRAHELCLEYKVFSRPLGLAGELGAVSCRQRHSIKHPMSSVHNRVTKGLEQSQDPAVQ
jgi:hypothetical protein